MSTTKKKKTVATPDTVRAAAETNIRATQEKQTKANSAKVSKETKMINTTKQSLNTRASKLLTEYETSPEKFASLSKLDKLLLLHGPEKVIETFTDEELLLLPYNYSIMARPSQIPKNPKYNYAVFLGGRGSGKTWTASHQVHQRVLFGGFRQIGLLGQTAGEIIKAMIRGESGLLRTAHPMFRPVFKPSDQKLVWPNGAEAYYFSAEAPRSVEGPNFDFIWADEFAKWDNHEIWDLALPALRVDKHLEPGYSPAAFVSTTPRDTPALYELLAMPDIEVMTSSSFENLHNLSANYCQIINKFKGTQFERQYLYGELLQSEDDALWDRPMIDDHRCNETYGHYSSMDRIVIGVDPAMTSNKKSDLTGIVVAGKRDTDYYVFEDASMRAKTDVWVKHIFDLVEKYRAHAIVIETNQGGDEYLNMFKRHDRYEPSLRIEKYFAKESKHKRMEPISMLYSKGLVHHVGSANSKQLGKLERQMVSWKPELRSKYSPDRIDALCMSINSLLNKKRRRALRVLRS